MVTSALFNLRGLHTDESLRYAAWFYEGRFWSILGKKNPGWPLFYELQDFFNEVIEMAGKAKNASARQTRPDFGSVAWVNVSLTDEDISAIDTWIQDDPDLLTEIVSISASGFSFAVKPSSDGDGFMSTIIGKSETDPSALCGVSGYGESPFDAITSALYKFVVRLDGKFVNGARPASRRFR